MDEYSIWYDPPRDRILLVQETGDAWRISTQVYTDHPDGWRGWYQDSSGASFYYSSGKFPAFYIRNRWIMLEEAEFPHGYICSGCAKKKKLRWPRGHCATFHTEVCPYCDKTKSLCAVTDYLKPWQKTIPLGSWD